MWAVLICVKNYESSFSSGSQFMSIFCDHILRAFVFPCPKWVDLIQDTMLHNGKLICVSLVLVKNIQSTGHKK